MTLTLQKTNSAKTDERIILEIPVSRILPSPHQPRRCFDKEELTALAMSIRNSGILQPLVVKPYKGDYCLVAGERRLRAAALAGLETVPCILYDKKEDECALATMIENLQRKNLSYWEEAYGYRALLDKFGYTQEQLARRVGKTQSTVANKLRLLKLPPTVQALLSAENLSERHARALLSLQDPEQIYAVAQTVIRRNYTVAQTEDYIARLSRPKRAKPSQQIKDRRLCLNTIHRAVGLIRQAGIKAVSETTENDTFIEYIIRIPKQ
ncbi:MAG: ParB/RepB/Spo0J family partition protein [Clostridia bacterium]|nr:ParB/RepB/Spo0J family partition protein [Clostridia bacterium]